MPDCASARCPRPGERRQDSPAVGRRVLEEVQRTGADLPAVDAQWVNVPGGSTGEVRVRIVRPVSTAGPLPVLLYLHGAGWVFGNAHTHDRLVRELAVGAEAAVVFPEYGLSPEHRYPVAIEQIWTVARWIVTDSDAYGPDASRIAVAGDSVGGNMSAALTLMAKERGRLPLVQQVLFHPVTDASFDTGSDHQFATGSFLRREGMRWFWDQYTTDPGERAQPTASPLRATTERMTGLPPALVITAEADALRDEGEAYANRLRVAGVSVTVVRHQGIIHDFVILNALRSTYAAQSAITRATAA
ncbi:alpha/beta hydrolase [Streptomyces sp. NPDC012438]|uniref:alpha/beta hydrolase n=1 Tax=Streptomyces sp. NPDC012438 TaxID=3364833 RepID=UPI0036EA5CCF